MNHPLQSDKPTWGRKAVSLNPKIYDYDAVLMEMF